MARKRPKEPSQRQRRVGEELRHRLSELFMRGDVHDPELRDVPLTVTEVLPTPDLKQATVYVMPLGGGEEAVVVEALNRIAPYLQTQVGRALTMKYTPRLSFRVDPSFDEAERVERLLRDERVARDLAAGTGGDAPEDDDGA